jgi:hypothetical protein
VRSHKTALGLLAGACVAPAAITAAALAASTPTVSTGGTTDRTQTSATLHATINPNGSTTHFYFQVGLNTTYGLVTATHSAGKGTKPVAGVAGIANLTPGTVYHYRVVATNAAGGAFGADRTFKTTGPPPPTATTGGAIRVGHAYAVVTGTVGTQGAPTHWAFQYEPSPGTAPPPSYQYQSAGADVASSAAPVNVSETLKGLASGTTFHYRLVAYHGIVAVSYGADQYFTTLPYPRLHARLTATTLPRIAASKPYLFTTTGTLVAPASLPPGVACSGSVAVRFLVGHRSVASRLVPVQPNCTFSSQVLFHRLIHHRSRRLRVEVRFHGNGYLTPASARAQRVRLGI